MRTGLILGVLFVGGFATPLCAQEAAAPAAPAPAPATQPATAAAVIDVTEVEKLKGMIGQEATVRGKVSEVFVPRSASVTIFNFEGINRRDFNVVIDKANLDAVNAGFSGDVAAAVKDQTIAVTGPVADYRGKPQIKLDKPEQLKIEPAAAAATEEKPAEKKSE